MSNLPRHHERRDHPPITHRRHHCVALQGIEEAALAKAISRSRGCARCVIFVTLFCHDVDAAPCCLGAPIVRAEDQEEHGGKHYPARAADQCGRHAFDRPESWIESHPYGAIAQLAGKGTYFPNACTTAPSDSYPGMRRRSLVGTPKAGGLFYDDSYDREEYPSKDYYTSQGLPDPGCTGTPGTEVTNFEELDKTYNYSTALVADITGGGTLGQVYTQLDPDHMQRKIVNGVCKPVYPHEYVRTNTVFEVLKDAGLHTVWSE